jgi:host factor-I protein
MSATSLQQAFLDAVVAEQAPVTVFLVNGVKLQGLVVSHDPYTLALAGHGHTQMINKRAISTIFPVRPLRGLHGEEEA